VDKQNASVRCSRIPPCLFVILAWLSPHRRASIDPAPQFGSAARRLQSPAKTTTTNKLIRSGVVLLCLSAAVAYSGVAAAAQSAPVLIAVPKAVRFGRVTSPAQQTVTITNKGGRAATGTIFGPGAPFEPSASPSGASFTLKPSQSLTLTLPFNPPWPGKYRARILVSSNARDGNLVIPVLATVPPGVLHASPPHLSFAPASSPQTTTLTLLNAGPFPVTLMQIQVAGPHAGEFDFSASQQPPPIAPGQSWSVQVTFNPDAQRGARRAKLVISSNARNRILRVAMAGRSLGAVPIVTPTPTPTATPTPTPTPTATPSSDTRIFSNVVNVGSPEFLFLDQFKAYIDAISAIGIRTLRVSGAWREFCHECAPQEFELNTEPSPGTFDFSAYFERLDYAIEQKGMRVVLTFSLAGQLDSDPLVGGSQQVFPAFVGPDDLQQYRASDGTDRTFVLPQPNPGGTEVPRFEKPAVRQQMLDFVTAVVTQFRARYGDSIRYYSFVFNTTGENEYALGVPDSSFCDTSADARAQFQSWLSTRYATPQLVSQAWGHTPPFTSFSEIEILDGKPAPTVGQAPQAYLDFMAYREYALGSFLGDIRDRVHAAGGRVMAQYGSVWDALSAKRGTFGFGRQIDGFDLVLIDDAPAYDHLFSMDYTRTNSSNAAFGNEVDSVCFLACKSGNLAACCDGSTFPDKINNPSDPDLSVELGTTRFDAQVTQSYERGATYVDMANWDNFWQSAFPLFATSIASAVALGSELVTPVSTSVVQEVSLRDFYIDHDDEAYLNEIIAEHAALGGNNTPVAVSLSYDL
jgi:Beta-galactosidase